MPELPSFELFLKELRTILGWVSNNPTS
jgi:hypothetical protein